MRESFWRQGMMAGFPAAYFCIKAFTGKIVAAHDTTALLKAVIRPGDRVCLEGDNQKQADLLAGALAAADAGKIRDLHMVQRLRERGAIRRPEDLGIDLLDADRSRLAARSIKDLVDLVRRTLCATHTIPQLVSPAWRH